MNVFDISAIEEEMKVLVSSLGISPRIYSNRPKAKEQTQDFVVIECGAVTDRKAYGECTLSVHLFARDINGLKNSGKLSMMYSRLAKGLPAVYGRLLFETEPRIIGDTPDDYGFHARIIDIQTTIKIQ